jgi:hypothetical protein
LFESWGKRVEAGLFNRIFNCFTGFAGVLLNPARQFLGLAFGTLEFVAREFGPLLFQLAFDEVKVALDFEFCHKICGLGQLFWNDIATRPRRFVPPFFRCHPRSHLRILLFAVISAG